MVIIVIIDIKHNYHNIQMTKNGKNLHESIHATNLTKCLSKYILLGMKVSAFIAFSLLYFCENCYHVASDFELQTVTYKVYKLP